MSHLLVIGGSGFFGKSILESFRLQQLEKFSISRISILSRNAKELKKNYPYLINTSIDLINDDITSCTSLPTADLIIHAAASANGNNYKENPIIEYQNMVNGVINFSNLIIKNNNKETKIIYISSGAVYGQNNNLKKITEDDIFISIESLDKSKQEYAKAKRYCESIFSNLANLGFKISIARCFAFVGYHLPRNLTFAIGNFIEDGLNKRAINVKTQKLVYRSYLDADDLVNWLMIILNFSSNSCPVFNVGSDKEISIQELANKIAHIFNINVNIGSINKNEVDRYIPSIDRAKGIGCQITNDLDSSLIKVISRLI